MDLEQQREEEAIGQPIIILVGPTAIGKTELALTVAETFGCEIVGVDSVQIYRFMDIGTAKPTDLERGRVPHHLIDYILPDEEYSATRFVADCQDAIQQIQKNGKIPLLVGGTGLYFSALEKGIFVMPEIPPDIRHKIKEDLHTLGRDVLWQELTRCDPNTSNRIHPNDTYRLLRALEIVRSTGVPWSEFIARHQQQQQTKAKVAKIGLARDRNELYARIEQRVGNMVNTGLLKEVEKLLALGYPKTLHSMQSLGYRHIHNYLDGEWTWGKSIELLVRDTRRYAKRQLTWFRADQEITWFHPKQVKEIITAVSAYLTGLKNN
ncbi:MAG: tRNA (adenosine(37)-N6)-dimethylallyltransferase MiaA [Proteobacteria bacterium]|nr:tRNA (adenosine(37)-N6)-dimethylallyltransferase MiaA [Desulfobulbaceae bacterium]MBU4151421.1 tRNA (adenosine(37)-N6)-dimethylallyltransferase MiaA [Pseudomonadota bacterium]